MALPHTNRLQSLATIEVSQLDPTPNNNRNGYVPNGDVTANESDFQKATLDFENYQQMLQSQIDGMGGMGGIDANGPAPNGYFQQLRTRQMDLGQLQDQNSSLAQKLRSH